MIGIDMNDCILLGWAETHCPLLFATLKGRDSMIGSSNRLQLILLSALRALLVHTNNNNYS